MKKILSLMLLASGMQLYAEGPTEMEGIFLLPDFYGQKISHDGSQIVGEAIDGSAVYYNRVTGEAYYYEGCYFGRGYVTADNGWIVGSSDSEDRQTQAAVMAGGKVETPKIFSPDIYSNIHSITPDASRICGMIGNNGRGPSYLPYVCDIDENGNFEDYVLLPTPPKDFFGTAPQFCTATWISEDGKTIAGQVIQSRGILVYPILYTQDESGAWSYSFPTESLFNPNNLEIPRPLGDFEEEFPGVVYPEVEHYLSPDKVAAWQAALILWESNNFADNLDPYNHLDQYMTPEEYDEYEADALLYNIAVEEYSEMNEHYWEMMLQIADESVFFIRNAMALSADGKWLASSAEIADTTVNELDEPTYSYVPYLVDLTTGEAFKIGKDGESLVTNQVLPNGDVVCATPAITGLPVHTYLYKNAENAWQGMEEYIAEVNPEYGQWMKENLEDELPIGVDEEGFPILKKSIYTGMVAVSEDMSVVSGGVDGYFLYWDQYITYIMDNLTSGIESISSEATVNGVFKVYNLQGVKVLETRHPEEVKSLSKGLYIINGKKIAL